MTSLLPSEQSETLLLAGLVFDPPVIAHRGVRALAPENTLAAFNLAAEQGIHWVETDVKLTHDGVPILMHDDALHHTTNGQGAVADATWEYVRTLDAGISMPQDFMGTPVPRLVDFLKFCIAQKLRVNLEIKPCTGRTQATTMVAMIEAAKIWPEDYPPPLISSFDIEALTIASRLHPEWPRGLLLDDWRDDWAHLVRQTAASTININAASLNHARIQKLKEARLPILAYTVNDALQAKKLFQWGVTALFSDNPTEIMRAL